MMMGFFAVYAGLLYNDFFSLGVNLFGSRWRNPGHASDRVQYLVPNFDPRNAGQKIISNGAGSSEQYQVEHGGPYPFGVDPAWKGYGPMEPATVTTRSAFFCPAFGTKTICQPLVICGNSFPLPLSSTTSSSVLSPGATPYPHNSA